MARMNAEASKEPLTQLLQTLHEIQIEKTQRWDESMQRRLDVLVLFGSSPVAVENVDPENREELLVNLAQIKDKAAGLKLAYGEIACTGKTNDRRKLDDLFEDVCAITENAVLLWRPEVLEAVDEALRPSVGL